MKPKAALPRSVRLLTAFETAGDVLLLQLMFVAAALPVVTMLPAALALQKSLADVFLEGRTGTARIFRDNLIRFLGCTWKVAFLLPLFMLLAAVSLMFWSAADGPAGIIALAILVPIFGVATAGYIAALASTLRVAEVKPGRDGLAVWSRGVWSLAQRRAIPLAISVVVMATWLLVLLKLPTLVIVGTGLVPAGLAWWVAAPWIQQRRADAARKDEAN